MFAFEKKLITISELCERLASIRDSRKVVACSGSFDVVHAGHAMMLEEARAQGDVLVVFLNTDESIGLYKGPSRPAIPFRDRAAILASMVAVDYVIPLEELTPLSLIEQLKPDIYFNGADWGDRSVERTLVESYGGSLRVASAHVRVSSSSDLIRTIKDRADVPTVRGIFLDRDGVLIKDRGYVHTPDEVELMPGVIEGLRLLRDAGWQFYVVTNQSGIGRGMYSTEAMEKTHAHIRELLAKSDITIKSFYHCPHTPEEGCLCRKPGVGMLIQAAKEHGIALSKSWMIGDRSSDIAAGRLANMKTIAVAAPGTEFADSTSVPDAFVLNLEAAAAHILGSQ